MNRRQLLKFLRLSPRQHAYLARAVVYLALARMDFGRLPAKTILDSLQRPPATRSTAPPHIEVNLLSWAVRAAASGVPWRSDCLIQSMAADRWLRRHGIAPRFRLGVSPASNGSILAHAWVEHDGVVLTGGDDIASYEVLIASGG